MTDRAAPDRQRVVVLAGPSGAGKSRLAARLNAAHGWPIFRLDDFYRDLDDPAMPRSEDLGIVDWDHPDSWNGDRAVESLCALVDTGRTDTPVYDISTSRAVGHHEVTADPADLIIAEGIFAAEVVDRLRACGVLHSAWCVHHRPAVTFVRRLARDLKERRKPPVTLVRRGPGPDAGRAGDRAPPDRAGRRAGPRERPRAPADPGPLTTRSGRGPTTR